MHIIIHIYDQDIPQSLVLAILVQVGREYYTAYYKSHISLGYSTISCLSYTLHQLEESIIMYTISHIYDQDIPQTLV